MSGAPVDPRGAAQAATRPGSTRGAPSGPGPRAAPPRPAPPRVEGSAPSGPGPAGSWAVRSRAVPSHAVHSGGTRNSLAMSAAKAGGVIHRARGRTLDAFPEGTRGGDGFGLRNLPPGEPLVWLRAPPAGPHRGRSRGRDQNKVSTVGAERLPRALWRRGCLRGESSPRASLAAT